jgi:hypothetical protein
MANQVSETLTLTFPDDSGEINASTQVIQSDDSEVTDSLGLILASQGAYFIELVIH